MLFNSNKSFSNKKSLPKKSFSFIQSNIFLSLPDIFLTLINISSYSDHLVTYRSKHSRQYEKKTIHFFH